MRDAGRCWSEVGGGKNDGEWKVYLGGARECGRSHGGMLAGISRPLESRVPKYLGRYYERNNDQCTNCCGHIEH